MDMPTDHQDGIGLGRDGPEDPSGRPPSPYSDIGHARWLRNLPEPIGFGQSVESEIRSRVHRSCTWPLAAPQLAR